jgi:hypothetical protein
VTQFKRRRWTAISWQKVVKEIPDLQGFLDYRIQKGRRRLGADTVAKAEKGKVVKRSVKNLVLSFVVHLFMIIQGKDEKTGVAQFVSFIKRMEPKTKLDLESLLDRSKVEGYLQLWTLRNAEPSTVGNKMKTLSLLYKWMGQIESISNKWSHVTAMKTFVDDVRQDYRKLNIAKINTAKRDDDLLQTGQWLTVSLLL